MMIGEIGGPQEAEAAAFVRDHMKKPVIAYVAGLTAPKGRRMGHAGAIISAFGESASETVEILKEAGVTVATSPAERGQTVAGVLAACTLPARVIRCPASHTPTLPTTYGSTAWKERR